MTGEKAEQEFPMRGSSGNIRPVDIRGDTGVIEVKSGAKMRGAVEQAQDVKSDLASGYSHSIYAPRATAAQLANFRKEGIDAFNKIKDVIEHYLRNKADGW